MSVLEVLAPDPFTRDDLIAAGGSIAELRSALDDRRVRRLLTGVYVCHDVPDSVELRCRAAARVISPRSVVRDRTAAWLHGVQVFDYHETEILPPVETAVPRWRTPTRRVDHAGRTRDLADRDVEQLHGLCVTTPVRTALDLGCTLQPRSALAALDAFMRAFVLTRSELEHEAKRFRRRRGVVQLRRLLSMADGRAESPGESWTRYALIDAGLPEPEPQWWVEVDGIPTYRLDLAYPRHRVAVEYDGEEFHTSPDDRQVDRQRRKWLRDHGWIVIVVRRDSFTPHARDQWTRLVREALAGRTWRRI